MLQAGCCLSEASRPSTECPCDARLGIKPRSPRRRLAHQWLARVGRIHNGGTPPGSLWGIAQHCCRHRCPPPIVSVHAKFLPSVLLLLRFDDLCLWQASAVGIRIICGNPGRSFGLYWQPLALQWKSRAKSNGSRPIFSSCHTQPGGDPWKPERGCLVLHILATLDRGFPESESWFGWGKI